MEEESAWSGILSSMEHPVQAVLLTSCQTELVRGAMCVDDEMNPDVCSCSYTELNINN